MSIINKLPQTGGTLFENVDLSKKSFFGTAGSAEVLFTPKDMSDLVSFLRNMPKDIQVTIIGAMSNILVRSKGIHGVVIVLGDWFNKIFIENGIIEVGAVINCSKLSTTAMDNQLGGLEFLMGIPGTIGGAIKMNAGCYGSEVSEILVECECVDSIGQVKWLKAKDINFSYRTSGISDDLIITRAWFRGNANADYNIARRTNEIIVKRKNSQPLNKKSCGSVFRNPKDKKAWELIDKAGCRGMKFKGAVVSDKHCNFIINDNNAASDDIEELGELVVQKVFENSGIKLEWEIIRLGSK